MMKNGFSQNFICLCILSSIFLFQSNLSLAQDCNCTEYVYLNEASPNFNDTYKFQINADGSITEILNSTTGGAWADNLTTDPRGLDKYSCDGGIVQADYFPSPPNNDGTGGVAGYLRYCE